MKVALKVAGCLVLLVLALGFFVEIGESIPDRALVYVFPSRKIWIPDSKEGATRLDSLLSDPNTRMETLALTQEITPATYGEIRKGKYKGFRLAPGWGSYTDTYVTGYSASIIRYYVATPKSRWNDDGTWKW